MCPRLSEIRPLTAPCSRSSAATTVTLAQPDRSTTSATAPVVEDVRCSGGDRLTFRLERREQRLVAQGRHLDDLAEGGAQLALRQRAQGGDVQDDRRRVVERAEQVLALGQVHAGLAADGRVDLRHQRGRYLDPRDATQVGGRKEPGRVAQRAAADRDQRLAPLHAASREVTRRVLDDGQALGGLAGREHDRLDRPSALRERIRKPVPERRPGARLRDQDRAARSGATEHVVDGAGGDALADHDLADRRRAVEQRRSAAGCHDAASCSTASTTDAISATPFTRWAAP